MSQSGREVEVKLAFASSAQALQRIEQLGARRTVERAFEDNILYERDSDPLKPQDKLLRLRTVGGRSLLTYKAPVEGRHRHKVRIEHETDVTDGPALERILAGLGMRPAWRYQKYRTVFELEGLELCVDETPLGCYVELEGDPATIDRVAARLGVDPSAYVLESYRELAEAAAGRPGGEPGDLVFEEPAS